MKIWTLRHQGGAVSRPKRPWRALMLAGVASAAMLSSPAQAAGECDSKLSKPDAYYDCVVQHLPELILGTHVEIPIRLIDPLTEKPGRGITDIFYYAGRETDGSWSIGRYNNALDYNEGLVLKNLDAAAMLRKLMEFEADVMVGMGVTKNYFDYAMAKGKEYPEDHITRIVWELHRADVKPAPGRKPASVPVPNR
jgi:hypothetical protein